MNREQRRARAKLEKKNGNSDMAEKISLFGKLENSCLVCAKPFDKKDKKQVMSWSVVVKENENQVNLYCPDCWNKARAIVDDFKKRVEERNDR